MLTELDERKGLVKTTWANIRKRVAKVEPAFTKLVDDLDPDKSFPIFLAYYPYGAITGDTESPYIGCLTNHVNLQRDFNIQSPPIKNLYDHWHLFKEIINSSVVTCDWRSCIMFFAEKWVNKMHTDKTWLRLKSYMQELGWHYSEYQRNSFYYDIAFSIMKKQRNLKPNPYLADTARHLFNTALRAAPGYAPACNDNSLPIDILQQAFVESYGLKKYHPTILKPTNFNFEEDKLPIYYSLQNPATHVFSPKSREVSSTLFEMRELAHVTRIFSEELAKSNSVCSDTIIGKIASYVEFNYFHNKTDRHKIVKDSAKLAALDDRFNFINSKYKVSGATFASDAPFVRGCISITTRF